MIPCHRVINSNGQVGGFLGNPDSQEKIDILTSEGVIIENGKISNSKYIFRFPIMI